MNGIRRRGWFVVVALLMALVAGCGVRPTGVITGGAAPVGPARGVPLFFVADQHLALVLRPTTPVDSVDDVLALLLAGPDPTERELGYGTEIPADAGRPTTTTSDPSGTTVKLSGDVLALSPTAVDQIVCTVRDAMPTGGPARVTLAGPDGSREPLTCSLPECPVPTDGSDGDRFGQPWCPAQNTEHASPRTTTGSGG
ncbi:GerMN domain-containing protein [Plantactinospora soyae]|uniref:GerMN domain-containing protein n=1 Tax=Plantactinospora soyae TaxID=1544732 RepID=A0A927MAZ9_9ACTN|nr:GerMN domain-containing protein [Plantactinospora soyae]MBE1491433.1 hypothetical protein [Plantactinospora soyae]